MTADQLALPLEDFVVPEHQPEATIEERFAAFNQANPWVLQSLEALATDWLAHGHRRVGVKSLFEVLRWQWGRTTTSGTYKLNNDFTSRYARLLVERHPEWADAIETRTLRAA